jgi:hypothetical protein
VLRSLVAPVLGSEISAPLDKEFFLWGGLAAQLKAEKLKVVLSKANGFRAAVSALRSLDGGRV